MQIRFYSTISGPNRICCAGARILRSRIDFGCKMVDNKFTALGGVLAHIEFEDFRNILQCFDAYRCKMDARVFAFAVLARMDKLSEFIRADFSESLEPCYLRS